VTKGQYELKYNKTFANYTGDRRVEIAKIIDLQTGEDALYVVYDKNLFKKIRYHTCLDATDPTCERPVVLIDDLHRACLLDASDVFFTMMLHELGHFLNGDLSLEYSSDKEIREERRKCTVMGTVQEVELKADAFAIKQVGKNTFNRTMDYMIRARKKRNDPGMELAIMELELRKKAAKKL